MKTQLTRCQVSAVPKKTAAHYYVRLWCQHRLKNIQEPKKLLHWLANLLNSGTRSEEERLFKVQLQWPSCSCTVYTLYLLLVCNNNVQFCKNKLLLLMVAIIVYRTLYTRYRCDSYMYLLRGNLVDQSNY